MYLPKPYGLDNPIPGAHISIRAKPHIDLFAVRQVIYSFGCPEFLLDRVESCLRHSDRYDCILSSGWFKQQHHQLQADLLKAGAYYVRM